MVGLFFLVRSVTADDTRIAASTPPASRAPARASIPQPKPFRVAVVSARGQPVDSSNLYGRRPRPRRRVVKHAARGAARVLERYLNAQFVRSGSRFTHRPLRKLLSHQARKELRKSDRAALGVAKLKVRGGRRGAAKVRAVVLHRGTKPYAVTLRYRAKIKLIVRKKPQALVQRGSMVFARTRQGWRADMVDVRLSLPRPAKAKVKRGDKGAP